MSRNTNNKYSRYNSSQRRLVTGREHTVEAIVGHHGYSEATLSCGQQSRAAVCLVSIFLFKVSSFGERKLFYYILSFSIQKNMN